MMKWIATVMMLVLVLCSGCLFGCAWIKPTTQVSVNPLTRTISIYNTKDVDLAIEGFEVSWDNKSGTIELEKIVVSDKASSVIDANVKQMLAFTEQQRAANEGIAAALAGIRDIVDELATTANDLRVDDPG